MGNIAALDYLSHIGAADRLTGPALRNLVLAGDYTDTGLPATIEGAIRSGRTAARLVLR